MLGGEDLSDNLGHFEHAKQLQKLTSDASLIELDSLVIPYD